MSQVQVGTAENARFVLPQNAIQNISTPLNKHATCSLLLSSQTPIFSTLFLLLSSDDHHRIRVHICCAWPWLWRHAVSLPPPPLHKSRRTSADVLHSIDFQPRVSLAHAHVTTKCHRSRTPPPKPPRFPQPHPLSSPAMARISCRLSLAPLSAKSTQF